MVSELVNFLNRHFLRLELLRDYCQAAKRVQEQVVPVLLPLGSGVVQHEESLNQDGQGKLLLLADVAEQENGAFVEPGKELAEVQRSVEFGGLEEFVNLELFILRFRPSDFELGKVELHFINYFPVAPKRPL